MCVCELHFSRQANGDKVLQKEQWRTCAYGNPDEQWECIRYHEEDDEEYVHTAPRSSGSIRSFDSSSAAPSSVSRSSTSSSRRHKKSFTGLALSAFFGDSKRTRRRRSESRSQTRSQTRVIVEDRVPRAYPPTSAPRAPHVYPITPSPSFGPSPRDSGRWPSTPMSPMSPLTPRFEGSWEDAVIIEVSPENRGRRAVPVIHDDGHRPHRSASIEVHVTHSTAPSRAPSPISYGERRRQEKKAADEEKDRRRDARIAELERDVAEDKHRKRREKEERLHYEEIRARPARPIVHQDLPLRGIVKPSKTEASDSVFDDLDLSRRGREVLQDAMAAREREDRRREEERRLGDRFRKDRREDRAREERHRLRGRFANKERVVYRDDY